MIDLDFDPPTGLRRFRVTHRAIYFYHRRFTLSFSWCLRAPWWPEWNHEVGAWYGWSITWGRWQFEKLNFGPYDDWGVEVGEIDEAILGLLTEACKMPRLGNVDEAIAEFRAAGLDAWDDIEDPEAFLREMREP